MAYYTRSDFVYAGWLDRRGTSLITPWAPRWVVLTLDYVQVFKDQKLAELKAEVPIDRNARVLFVDQVSNGTYKFCIINSQDIIEFGVHDIDLRNMWLQKFLHATEKKSRLGGISMRVNSENHYKHVRQWEKAVIADSIDKSTGVMVFQTVTSDVYLSKEGSADSPKPQKHLSIVTEGSPHYASFMPYDEWQIAFEPEVRAAAEQAKKDEELRQRGYKTPDPNIRERARDYFVDNIVTNVTNSSTRSFCCSLLDGMIQLIAASERQLARQYRLASAAKENLAVVASASASGTAVVEGQSKDGPPLATSVQDIADTSLLVVTEPPPGVELPDTDSTIPLSVQADLLCALGSLRGLIMSYRFDSNPANEAQIRFTRRLTVHQLERSLSKVLQSLEDLQKEELQKVLDTAKEKAEQLTAEQTVEKVKQEVSDRAVEKLDTLTVQMIMPTPAPEKDSNNSTNIENNNENNNTNNSDAPSEQDTAYERGLKIRKASLKQLRAILRPLLSREFLKAEAAPLLSDFMKRNNTNLDELEGLAKEVTDKFGKAAQEFIEEKVVQMEEIFVAQLESLMGVISEYEQMPSADELTERVKEKAKAAGTSTVSTVLDKLDDPSLKEASPPASGFPKSSREVMVTLAQEKAALDRKIAKIKTEGSVLWDGSEKSLIEMVLLEKTDVLWQQLQDSVRLCVNKGIWAILDFTGSGLHPSNVPPTSGAPPPPSSPTPPPAASGYFF